MVKIKSLYGALVEIFKLPERTDKHFPATTHPGLKLAMLILNVY